MHTSYILQETAHRQPECKNMTLTHTHTHFTLYQNTKETITHLSKYPFLVEAVDEEDGGLRKSHEEVADCQVHD